MKSRVPCVETDRVVVAEGIAKLRLEPLNHMRQVYQWCRVVARIPRANLSALEELSTWIDIQRGDPVQFGGAFATVKTEHLFADETRFDHAALHLFNAVKGYSDPVWIDDPSGRALKAYVLWERLSVVRLLCLVGLLCLSLLETPSWCYGPYPETCTLPPLGAPPGSTLYFSNITYLSPLQGLVFELGLLVALFVTGSALELVAFSSLPLQTVAVLFCLGIGTTDTVIELASVPFGVYRAFRLCVWMRPLLFVLALRSGLTSMRDIAMATLREGVLFFKSGLLRYCFGDFCVIQQISPCTPWAGCVPLECGCHCHSFVGDKRTLFKLWDHVVVPANCCHHS